jgi:nucleotide-binding universal stress UspA family protein
MQPILVPTDFSPTAYNAAQYAIGLAAQLQISKIILYNAYQQYIAEDPMMMTVVAQDPMELKKISEEGLSQMVQSLREKTTNLPQVECVSDYNTITNGVLETCQKI